MSGSKPTIHILGGGPSGLSAAFHLTSPTANPDWQSRYDVVVHQLGWRLGGKGATGRHPDRAWRVEEHGIHLFGNMYTNSLHMMHEALGELNDGRTMETEFEPSEFSMITDFVDGRWQGFEGAMPGNSAKPWEIDSSIGDISDLADSVATAVEGITEGRILPTPGEIPEEHKGMFASAWAFIKQFGTDKLGDLTGKLSGELVELRHGDGPTDPERVVELIEDMLDLVDDALGAIAGSADKLRWIFVEMDLLATALRGTLADRLFDVGIDAIDGEGYREWLQRHGAKPLTMQSSVLEAIPNTCMQYPQGDSTVLPEMSAAAYLTFILRQVLAPGEAAYFFKVGTGETVILPLYDVLVARGVTFEFFHKITDLVPSADGSRIDAIDIEVQATAAGGGSYDPIATMPDGQRVWPSEALYDRIAEGPALKADGVNLESWWADWTGTPSTVQLGPDDQVIVAMPPQAVRHSCSSALAASPGWQTMIDRVPTAATQALQIWLDKPLSELGWRDLEGTNRWLGPTYTAPISAFGDFTESIAYEAWPAASTPRGCIYFCGVLQDPAEIPAFDDHQFPHDQHVRVGAMAGQYLRQLGGLLPGAANGQVDENSLDFSLLTCFDESTAGVGEARVQQQYFRANIDPNERYTVSAPGTLQYRLKAWESGFANVALSSDAIYTGFNIGSFEAAVMSGKLASLTVSGGPTLDHIWGYDFMHPGVTGPVAPTLPNIPV